MNTAVRQWQQTFNHVRPHHSLAFKAPAEYLEKYWAGFATHA
jgi:transposase InsO family protein